MSNHTDTVVLHLAPAERWAPRRHDSGAGGHRGGGNMHAHLFPPRQPGFAEQAWLWRDPGEDADSASSNPAAYPRKSGVAKNGGSSGLYESSQTRRMRVPK
jgi:hypothetical protein